MNIFLFRLYYCLIEVETAKIFCIHHVMEHAA